MINQLSHNGWTTTRGMATWAANFVNTGVLELPISYLDSFVPLDEVKEMVDLSEIYGEKVTRDALMSMDFSVCKVLPDGLLGDPFQLLWMLVPICTWFLVQKKRYENV